MNLSESWDLEIDRSIVRTLNKVPRRDAVVLLQAIKLLPLNPYFGDIKKMKGEIGVWRRRIGAYRIFYKLIVPEKTILVFRLERRSSKTY